MVRRADQQKAAPLRPPSVTELEADIRKWISAWNANPKPFIWTKAADEILDTLAAYCRRINESRH